MPSYTFKRKSTGEEWVDSMKIAEMEELLKTDPDLDVIPGAVPQGDPFRLGVWKPDNHSQWREVLKKVHKAAGKESKINTM
jgi:hypothetical protein